MAINNVGHQEAPHKAALLREIADRGLIHLHRWVHDRREFADGRDRYEEEIWRMVRRRSPKCGGPDCLKVKVRVNA